MLDYDAHRIGYSGKEQDPFSGGGQQTDPDEKERAAACFLHTIPGIGKKTLQKLQQEAGSLWNVFQTNPEHLKKAVRSSRAFENMRQVQGQEQEAWKYYQKLKQQGMGILLKDDLRYPKILEQIFDPPFILYWKGDLSLADRPALAVVGCRQSTAYGRNQAEKFAEELAAMGIVIVSGLARGIDTAAHKGALKAVGGKTIAVLGSGVSVVYPSENQSLAEEIAQKGLLLSEFSPATRPEAGNFPQRNRIISGLSKGVLVVEARRKSGALITADFAMEQGREVYAVPGLLTNPCSEGTHRLIQQGAKLVVSTEDILENYVDFVRQELEELPPDTEKLEFRKTEAVQETQEVKAARSVEKLERNEIIKDASERRRKEIPQVLSLTAEEKSILNILNGEPMLIDDIFLQVKMSPGDIIRCLLQMEIQGIIVSLPGNCYMKK